MERRGSDLVKLASMLLVLLRTHLQAVWWLVLRTHWLLLLLLLSLLQCMEMEEMDAEFWSSDDGEEPIADSREGDTK